METQHAQYIDDLEKKLQHAIRTHKEMEQKLQLQLETVQQEQQAAVENARKVSTILTRVSSWMRQVQRSAQAERHSRHVVKSVSRDLELTVTPRSDSPYTLWTTGASLATNVPECHDEPRQATLPPPAPGRNRSKRSSLPGKGFHYRSPGALFAYCAQVVTTSLAGVRSSPEPRVKVTPAWKGDRLPQRPSVALPSLSIGLL
ncbi:hypothetical protein PHYSODRAFT_498356 [Phytophthora sojae]|uniref:Uncharacterized protein n=1 Tax=Phytophthora sojae (strain P6497) TaxID=1094619 RepID=G4ZHB8_PHYSP|nr:hypothetical protein PHYSODRAFT_498356 [Phytophthora sojae]EGZ17167.1 hypothetical protein PHYSODRAFT_498356 [Phytophthora sojae]|eukprot:XP_009526225.1 hypothetical protein PHYSODRAFT_498356 [Phytophthora sojae]